MWTRSCFLRVVPRANERPQNLQVYWKTRTKVKILEHKFVLIQSNNFKITSCLPYLDWSSTIRWHKNTFGSNSEEGYTNNLKYCRSNNNNDKNNYNDDNENLLWARACWRRAFSEVLSSGTSRCSRCTETPGPRRSRGSPWSGARCRSQSSSSPANKTCLWLNRNASGSRMTEQNRILLNLKLKRNFRDINKNKIFPSLRLLIKVRKKLK